MKAQTTSLQLCVQSNSTGDVTTCTFMGNTALNGGAIYSNLASGEICLNQAIFM